MRTSRSPYYTKILEINEKIYEIRQRQIKARKYAQSVIDGKSNA